MAKGGRKALGSPILLAQNNLMQKQIRMSGRDADACPFVFPAHRLDDAGSGEAAGRRNSIPAITA